MTDYLALARQTLTEIQTGHKTATQNEINESNEISPVSPEAVEKARSALSTWRPITVDQSILKFRKRRRRWRDRKGDAG